MLKAIEDIKFDRAGSLDELSNMLPRADFMGGWAKTERSLWPEPVTKFVPSHWRWQDAKVGLDRAGDLISTEQADRRNLFMVNRFPGNNYATLPTLVTAYQMILPGERARSHRHTPNALRLVLDAENDVYTVVDGKRLDMRAGDVVLTPGWCWHGHANDGGQAAYWVDYLDVPLVHRLESMFLEEWQGGFQQPTETDANSPYVFPWKDTLQRLMEARRDESGHHGPRIELGLSALPTMSLYMEQLDVNERTKPYKTTASQIITVVSGAGMTFIGDKCFSWHEGDVLALPAWHAIRHSASKDSVFFTVSDEPVFRALGFFKKIGC